MAVQKLRRLATKTGEKLGSKRMATAVQVFNTASQGSEAVRHMLEHEEDYLFGDGHLQRSGTPGYSWTFNAHRENVEAPARHTISVLEGQYKLIVEETAVLAETLIQEAIAALEELRSTSPS